MLGSVWARSVWGVSWTWDARLVTTVVLLLSYVGYLGVRGLSGDWDVTARRSSGSWRSSTCRSCTSRCCGGGPCQPPTVLQPAPAPTDPTMVVALLVGVAAFSLAALWVGLRRTRVLTAAAPPAGAHLAAASEPSRSPREDSDE